MNTPISLKQLDIFVKIVDSGGLSESAVLMNISLSAVSKNLAAMEDLLGTTLIKRTTRSITLTEAGQYFYNRASKLLKSLMKPLTRHPVIITNHKVNYALPLQLRLVIHG
jgi:DNA-binding transcriptional LysR family regulator